MSSCVHVWLLLVVTLLFWEGADNLQCVDSCSISDDNLTCWRSNIDVFTKTIVENLNQRLTVAAHIGQWKLRYNRSFYDAERVGQVFQQIREYNSGPVTNTTITDIFSVIINYTTVFEEQHAANPPPFSCRNQQSATSCTPSSIPESTCLPQPCSLSANNQFDWFWAFIGLVIVNVLVIAIAVAFGIIRHRIELSEVQQSERSGSLLQPLLSEEVEPVQDKDT